MTILTVPVGILILGAIGVGWAVRRVWSTYAKNSDKEWRIDTVILLNLCVPIAIISWPSTPIFGGTKHWMPAMPFLALCAGVGGELLARKLWPRSAGLKLRWLTTALAAFMLLPAAWATVNYGHQGPVYFNGLAGGPPGAAMNYPETSGLQHRRRPSGDERQDSTDPCRKGDLGRDSGIQNCFGKMFDTSVIDRRVLRLGSVSRPARKDAGRG